MQMTYQEFQALSDEGKLKVSMGHLAAVLSTQNSISEEEETELLQTQINRQKALRDVEAVARKYGLTVEEILGASPMRKAVPVAEMPIRPTSAGKQGTPSGFGPVGAQIDDGQ